MDLLVPTDKITIIDVVKAILLVLDHLYNVELLEQDNEENWETCFIAGSEPYK